MNRYLASIALLFSAVSFAQTEPAGRDWELRVCAPPATMPFSHQVHVGFENRIAQIIADEMGAELTFDWHHYNADLFDLRFSEGTCDVIVGVPDGTERTLTTITYYQSPYVQVYRADAGFSVTSMDDPILHELDLAVQGMATPPHEALLMRGLTGNVRSVFGTEEGEDYLAAMVNAVAEGRIDVGFGWGPVVGYYAARHEVDLIVEPIEPAFDLPSIFQFQPMTMAVRPHDYAMQTRLNRAIAARWDDIQAVLAEYDVPVMPAPTPVAGPLPDYSRNLRIGTILPIPTGGRTAVAGAYNLIGEDARQGALQAERMASQNRTSDDLDVTLVFASSPSAEAAERAARAMVSLGEVDAIVGGLGTGQAEVLAQIAAEAGLPFINIGSDSLELREQCQPTTFHVQPSAAVWIDAMVQTYGVSDRPTRWYVLSYEDDAEAERWAEAAAARIAAAGDELVASVAIERYRPVYFDLLEQAESLDADAVMILLDDPADQLALMGQAEDAGYTLSLAPYPDILTQTREFLAASKRYGVALDVPRLNLWEPALEGERAEDLNTRFGGQWGLPLDSPAWATFQGVSVLAEAARLADSIAAEAVLEALLEVDAGALGGKTEGQFFSATTHELPQEVYAVAVNADNQWGIRLSAQIDAGTLLREIWPALQEAGCE